MSKNTPELLSLKEIASWQFPDLAKLDSQGIPIPPKILAGLPSLQRGSVWKPNQVELLWDSILRGFPIGALVVCDRLKNQRTRAGIHIRNKDKRWEEFTHHLLDGQQRANAVALGFLDPFPLDTFLPDSDSILWLDIAPEYPKSQLGNTTRSYLLRVTTLSHPWGFQVSDDASPKRLEYSKARDATQVFGQSNEIRPRPNEGWPIDANVPVPLAWVLSAAHQVFGDKVEGNRLPQSERVLWEHVLNQCKRFIDKHSILEAGSGIDKLPLAAPELRHWVLRAKDILQDWYDALGTSEEPEEALRLANALAHAVDARVVALPVPQDTIEQASRQEHIAERHTVDTMQNISNVEHLFQRLNGGGTNLSPEERAYSMIKAYWPGIEETIQPIESRPPEALVALLGARLGLDAANYEQPKQTLPPQPTVQSLRQLARTGVKGEESAKGNKSQAELQSIKTIFGIKDDGSPIGESKNAPITIALKKIDEWFLYSPKNTWGLPPVLRSRMAEQAPEVFLFLLRLAHHGITMPDESVRRKLLGLATALHWFGLDRELAVRDLWDVNPSYWLDGSAFITHRPKVLKSLRFHSVGKGGPSKALIAGILTKEQLAEYIKEESFQIDKIGDWKWWDSLVQDHVLASSPEVNAQSLKEKTDAYWKNYEDLIKILSQQGYRGQNALLLMYVQREKMEQFQYDTQNAGYWDEHNVPWDFDHLLQKNAFTDKRSGQKFIWACQQWGNTIANLHILNFMENRGRQDQPLGNIFPNPTPANLKKMLLWDYQKMDSDANRLSFFSMRSSDIRVKNAQDDREERERVFNFALEARARLIRIYSDWFDSLEIGTLI